MSNDEPGPRRQGAVPAARFVALVEDRFCLVEIVERLGRDVTVMVEGVTHKVHSAGVVDLGQTAVVRRLFDEPDAALFKDVKQFPRLVTELVLWMGRGTHEVSTDLIERRLVQLGILDAKNANEQVAAVLRKPPAGLTSDKKEKSFKIRHDVDHTAKVRSQLDKRGTPSEALAAGLSEAGIYGALAAAILGPAIAETRSMVESEQGQAATVEGSILASVDRRLAPSVLERLIVTDPLLALRLAVWNTATNLDKVAKALPGIPFPSMLRTLSDSDLSGSPAAAGRAADLLVLVMETPQKRRLGISEFMGLPPWLMGPEVLHALLGGTDTPSRNIVMADLEALDASKRDAAIARLASLPAELYGSILTSLLASNPGLAAMPAWWSRLPVPLLAYVLRPGPWVPTMLVSSVFSGYVVPAIEDAVAVEPQEAIKLVVNAPLPVQRALPDSLVQKLAQSAPFPSVLARIVTRLAGEQSNQLTALEELHSGAMASQERRLRMEAATGNERLAKFENELFAARRRLEILDGILADDQGPNAAQLRQARMDGFRVAAELLSGLDSLQLGHDGETDMRGLRRLAAERGLRTLSSFGENVKFNPAHHDDPTGSMRTGDDVIVVEAPVTVEDAGTQVVLRRGLVRAAQVG